MDGVKHGRSWRDRSPGERVIETRHEHTREIKDIPQELLDRISELEQFAAQAADTINRLNRENWKLQWRVFALSRVLRTRVAPMQHYHDYKGVRVA